MSNTKTKASAKEPLESSEAPKHAEEKAKPIIPKDVSPTDYVTVRNGFQGVLVYKTHSGEKFVWDEFGDEQEIELRELKNAKSSNKGMFENNWFMFDEPWVVDYLGVRAYYKNEITIDSFDEIFDKPIEELKETISKMASGLKSSVGFRARQLIADGTIDSRKVINALEEALHTELIEK